MNDPRDALRWIGGPAAISWPSFWVVLAFTALLQLTDAIGALELEDIPGRLVVIVASVVVMFAVMVLLRRLVLRDVQTTPRPGRTILVFLVGTVVRGLAIAVLLVLLVDVQTPIAYRVFASILTIMPVLLVTAVLVGQARERAARRADLTAAAERLRTAEEEAQAEVAEARDATVARIRGMLIRAVDEASQASPADAVQRLRDEVDRGIRPLSHRLAMTVPTWSPPLEVAVTADVAWRDLWRDATRGRPFRPLVTAVIGMSMILVGSIGRFGLAVGVLTAVVFGAFFGGTLVLARTLVGPWLAGSDRAAMRLIVFLAAASVASAVSIGGVAVVLLPIVAPSPAIVIAVCLIGPMLVALIATTQAIDANLREIDADLRATTVALDHAVARIHAVAWRQQRLLALAVHGPLQARITAAALRLEQQVLVGAATVESVDEALTDVLEALDQIDLVGQQRTDLRADLDEVAAAWEGVCTVAIDVDERLAQRIDDDPVSGRAVVDVFTEACSNAIRHARARSVDLQIDEDESGLLRIVVYDDGRAEAIGEHGLGSRLLDEISVRWDRQPVAPSTRLEVLLPALPGSEQAMATGA